MFKYFYARDYENKIEVTYALKVNDGTFALGRAFVHPKEQAEKRIGRDCARVRALVAANDCFAGMCAVNYDRIGDQFLWTSMAGDVGALRELLFSNDFTSEVAEWIIFNV